MVRDVCLCHGTAGIAMMFAHMYRETSDVLFKNTRDYWIDRTLGMARHPDGPAGYKQFTMRKEDELVKWEDSYPLLEGVAGIGLMLLSVLDAGAEKNLLNSFVLYQ